MLYFKCAIRCSVLVPIVALAANAGFCQTGGHFSDIDVTGISEVSGVATDGSGAYIVVGDANPTAALRVYLGRENRIYFADLFRNDGANICDCEDIEVGHNKDTGETKFFALSEDFRSVYVQGRNPIVLPIEFKEECGRGAEGLSVKWTQEGWDLLVILEGGIPETKEVPEAAKNLDCKRDSTYTPPNCPIKPDEIRDAKVIRYVVPFDGKPEWQKELSRGVGGAILKLNTKDLLKNDTKTEGFRASDITWYKDHFLVLLVSTPYTQDDKNGPFTYKWIQGFDLDGNTIPSERMELNKFWTPADTAKNWEGLDITPDETELVMSYDDPTKQKSEIRRLKIQF